MRRGCVVCSVNTPRLYYATSPLSVTFVGNVVNAQEFADAWVELLEVARELLGMRRRGCIAWQVFSAIACGAESS